METRMRVFAGVAAVIAACDGGTDAADTIAPPPGASADGWMSAFLESSAAAACGAGEPAFAGLPHVTVGATTIYAGYTQASANNQDPVVARFDRGVQVWCTQHETQPPDGRAHGLAWDGGDVAYVVYSVVGGGTALEGKGGWLSSYAPGGISGGGAKVSVIGQVDTSSGALVTSSYVIAVKSDNKVNSHAARAAPNVLADGTVEFLGSSAHKAIDADGKSPMQCTDYPFETRYRFARDLRTLTCADCTNCTSMRPCE